MGKRKGSARAAQARRAALPREAPILHVAKVWVTCASGALLTTKRWRLGAGSSALGVAATAPASMAVDGESFYEAMVIATFEAQDPAEMSCEELELLRVSTDPAPDGWCLASKGGAEGLVPKDYVVRLQPARLLADFSAEEEGEMAVTQGETVLVLPRPAPEGWAFVKRAADSAQGLVPADYLEDAAQESGDPGGVARSAMDLLRDAQPALVTADFEPEDAVELKVAAGELVLSLEQPAHAPGWTTVTKLASPEAPPGLVPTDYLEMAHGEMSAEFTAEEVGRRHSDQTPQPRNACRSNSPPPPLPARRH
eukprot:6424178-Prymnesium_polylepis.2